MKTKWIVLILLSASLLTHFIFFGYPHETVFDEVHFGKFISGYFTHQYFFDIHPPLGKLLISATGWMTGFQPGFSFAEIGQQFPNNHYLWLRLLPSLAGALLPLVIFFLALRLGLSRIASTAAALLLILDNALLVQSRFILLDQFLLLFGFLSLVLYMRYRQDGKITSLYIAGIMAALSLSVKWTGVSFLAIIGVAEIINIFKNTEKSIKDFLAPIISLIVIPFAIYFSIFTIHLGLLNHSGPGDAFMSPGFQKTLDGNNYQSDSSLKTPGIVIKFIELNRVMYTSNQGLTATHPYSSKWYTWPFMLRPIFYWQKHIESTSALPLGADDKIYFLGNPVVWWASTVAIIYFLIDWVFDLFNKKRRYTGWLLMIPAAYILNMLPFVGIKRVMFLYHYMIGLIFAVLALVYIIDQLNDKATRLNKRVAFGILIGASIIAFIYFAPLTYGRPALTVEQFNHRAWLSSWR